MTAQARIRWVAKPVVWALCLSPLAWLIWMATQGGLGANPIEAIIRYLGDWALRFLLIALAVTPVMKITGYSVLMRFRRLLGLFAFAYVMMHLTTYLVIDQHLAWADIWADIVKRWYITVGMTAFVLLAPLAATSTKAAIRRLGAARWKMLHRLAYLAGVAGVFHFYMLTKADFRQPLAYAVVLAVLLGYRIATRARKRSRRARRRATAAQAA